MNASHALGKGNWRLGLEQSLDVLNVRWMGLAVLVLLFAASYFGHPETITKAFWKSQPLAGCNTGEIFATLRAKMRTVFRHTEIVNAAYEKFNKAGLGFALPVIAGDPYLILPPSLMRPVMSKSDDEIDMRIVNGERLKAEYTLPGNMLNDPYANNAGRHLKQKLPQITDDMVEEIRLALQEEWPQSSDWTNIKLYSVAMRIVARVANRVFVGPELCRNTEFLEHSKHWSVGVVAGGTLIKLFPQWLHPIVGRIAAMANRRHMRICQDLCQPVIRRRLERLRADDRSDPQPNDLIQWFLESALEANDLDGLDPARITDRILTLNMVAMHTTSIAITNLVLNLYSSPRVDDYVAGFRDEVKQVMPDGSAHGAWTASAVNQLVRIDSALRETMRFSCLGDYQAIRMITAPNGISLPNGLHIPSGVHVGFPMRAMHRDSAFYSSPDEFYPFRFCEKRMQQALSNGGRDGATQTVSGEPSFVTPTKDYLGFGAGRHPCPGRFFAAHELKLLFAHLVEDYEIAPLAERPEPFSVLGITSPSEDWEVKTRKRT